MNQLIKIQLTMTKMLAPELAKFKIRINVVCPGAIETSTALSHILRVFISFLSLPTLNSHNINDTLSFITDIDAGTEKRNLDDIRIL